MKNLSKKDLIEKCKELNITDYTKKTIAQIITLINDKLNDDIVNIKPIIKWVGGKTQIIDKIIDNFPREINNYHELFIGGGSVLLDLLQNISKNKIKLNGEINAYDINETLINLYINIRDNPDDVIIKIKNIIETYYNLDGNIINRKPENLLEGITSKESYYYWIRKQYNLLTQQQKNTTLGTAYFIFLNKTCFRGIYREGPSGYNVPFGHYKNPEIINESQIKNVSYLIRNVNFYCLSFEQAFLRVNSQDFVYLDPPYAPENNKSFVNYTALGFSLEQHKLLFSICKKFNFLMSNANVELVRDSFNNDIYNTIVISCKRTINSKNPESKTEEVLIKSY